MMKLRSTAVLAIIGVSLLGLTACGNTIRGVGKDTANAVGATKTAVKDVARSAK